MSLKALLRKAFSFGFAAGSGDSAQSKRFPEWLDGIGYRRKIGGYANGERREIVRSFGSGVKKAKAGRKR